MESKITLKAETQAPVSSLLSRSLTLLVSGQAVAAVVGLVYGKATAVYVSPAELGYYNLLFAAMTFLHSLFITPTIQSFKASLSQEPLADVLHFHGRILLAIYTLALLAVGVAVLWTHSGLLLIVWGTAVGQGIYTLGNDYLNVAARYRTYTRMQVGYALVNLLLFGGIVVGLGWRNAAGLWWIVAILNTLFACLAIRNLYVLAGGYQRRLQAFDTDWLSTRLTAFRQYVMPLVSLALWAWIVNYADRYLIRHYLTDADVGRYAMGYSLGSKLLILVAPFVTHLTGEAIRSKAAGALASDLKTIQWRYARGYGLLAAVVCFIFFLGRNWFGELLLSQAYEPAFLVGPIIAVSYLCLTIIQLLEVKWYVYNTTHFVMWHYVAGAICNVALNLWLIPLFGINGAALAMAGSALCQLAVVVCLYFNS